jgi:hypothetical protein
LIPDFEFMEPIAHIIGSPELVILITTTIVMVLLTFLIKFTKDRQGHAGHGPGPGYGHAGGG